jgi:hypothetical protein
MISESEAPMMKQFFWTATAAFWLAATPAQAQSTLDKYLAKNSQSTGASANQKSDSGINKVFKSAEGYWRLDDTRANGGSCSVTYVSGAQFAGYVGPTASSPDSVIVFSAPSIPAIKSATNKKMTLTTADGKVQTVPAVHAPNVAQNSSGIILFRLTNIQAAMDEISDVENINVVMENKPAFAIKWAGGLAARKAMVNCLGGQPAAASPGTVTAGRSTITGTAFAKISARGSSRQYAPKGWDIALIHMTDEVKQWISDSEAAVARGDAPTVPETIKSYFFVTKIEDNKGTFRFTNLQPGEYLVRASFNYYQPRTVVTNTGDFNCTYTYCSQVKSASTEFVREGAEVIKSVIISKNGDIVNVDLSQDKIKKKYTEPEFR